VSPAKLRHLIVVLPLAGLAFLALPLTQWATRPIGPCDIFWQVRTGELAIATGRVPDVDPFSYTAAGARWNNHEWGFEITAALLYRASGWGGFRILVLVLVISIASALAVFVWRRAGPAWALLTVTLLSLFARYKMLPVPQLLSMALFLGACHCFRGERLACSGRRAAVLACYMLVWGNLTAESLMFLPFLILDQLLVRWAPQQQCAQRLPSRSRHLLRISIACLTPLITPPWSSTLAYLLVGTSFNRAVNSEFAPLWAPATAVTPFAKQVALAIVVVYIVWATVHVVRAGDRRAALRRAAPGALAVLLAVAFERNLWLLIIPVARLARQAQVWATTMRRQLVVALTVCAVAAGVFVRFAAVLDWRPRQALAQLTSSTYLREHLNRLQLPIDCVESIAGDPGARRVFTLRMWSNYLIWRLPQARVFVDGRNLEFPLELHRIGQQIWEASPAALSLLEQSKTDTVIAWPGWGDSPWIAGRDWRQVAAGPVCAVFKRVR
jgi:hypothetical protein